VLCSELGIIGYKNFSYKDSNILFCLIFPNYYGDEELAEILIDKILDYIYYALIMHIGLYDLFHVLNPQEIEKFKKFLEVHYILFNF